ncbi:MAG: FAD-binding oxidoreductase [Chloroflexota bacterium]|nr:FAD-binding oxidoreductase [Chloroflexota bacterium]
MTLLDALTAAVGSQHVLTDPDRLASYEIDWTRRFAGRALAVVRPSTTEEVVAILRACSDAGARVVPQGGNTGLVGGGVPRRGEVVVSLTRLAEVEPVDGAAGEVTVGAGVTLAILQAQARRAGYAFGVDLGARDSATIGGMIATNAGGVNALRYGPMRAQLVGTEAVLADGSIIARMPGLPKDNTGYHLPSLLAGSEGTLAVITRARLRLVPLLAHRAVALLGLDNTHAATSVMASLRHLPALHAAELFYEEGLSLVLRHAGLERPFRAEHPTYLLVEVADSTDPTDALVAVLAEIDAADVVVATDENGRHRLWQLRERHTEAINAEGIPHKLDVAVPIARLGEFERRVRSVVADTTEHARTILYGHIGDGNMHVNVLGLPPEDEAVDEAVLRLAMELDGSIAAEHGIGVAKARWLRADRGVADVAAMRAIKRALDPAGILNPGVIFPDDRADAAE